MKRFIILFTVLVIAAIGAVGYFMFFADKGTLQETFTDLNPFSDGGGVNTTPQSPQGPAFPGDDNSFSDPSKPITLLQVSKEAVTGYTFFTRTETKVIDDEKITITEPVVRYMDRGTGHISDYLFTQRTVEKISNTTMPTLDHTYFYKNASEFISQRLNETDIIETIGGTIASSSVDAISLENRLLQAIPAPTTRKLFLSRIDSGKYTALISDPDGSKAKVLFTSPLTEWWAEWINDTSILLTSKPSAGTEGSSYIINTQTGVRQPSITKQLGLLASVNPVSAVGTTLYSKTVGNTIQTLIRSGSRDFALTRPTLIDKCVWKKNGLSILCARPGWIPSASYPDDWLLGKVAFVDSHIDEIDAKTGTLLNSWSLEQSGVDIDAVRLQLSSNETMVGFMNKNDNTLWVLNINSAE
ncbi:MAG TPA: hypothetical protein PLF31_02755 [Candidatus Paceibacterota bacterium]|nr:hypothetical protein [Candidatus Paceibacterota bacterium]